jgi:hypothetical protein
MNTTEIRELNAEELVVVSGGNQVCAYEAAGKCYVWRDRTIIEDILTFINNLPKKT